MTCSHRPCSVQKNQRGVTVVVAMLFLLVLSIFAVSSFNSGTTNTRITGNMIARQESYAAAQLLIDRTISSAEFSTDPSLIAAEIMPVDLTEDGVPDYTAQLTPAPSCHRLRSIKNLELDAEDALDVPCLKGSAPTMVDSDTPDPSVDDSSCANTEWNVRATVADPMTGANVAINQGVGVRVPSTSATNFCS